MEHPSIFQGTLEEIRIPEIIQNLSRRKETGALQIKRDHLEKTLYFDEGKIVFSASNDQDERLGVLLLRSNKVTYRHLLECAPKVDTGKRLGTVLVLEGIIQPTDLYHGVIDQIKEIIYSVFDWETGSYKFQSGPLPQKEVITLNLSTPDLIMTGMQRIWRWSWIRKALPGLDTVFRKCEGWSPVVRKTTMTREMEAILDLFDRPRTLEEVLQISTLGNFETCRLIWSFLILAIIEEILIAPVWSESQTDAASASSAKPFSTQEMPAPVAPASVQSSEEPTLKIQVSKEPEPSAEITNPVPARDLEPLLAEPNSELSFSDLAEMTDSEKKSAETVQQEVPCLQPWETEVHLALKRFNEIHRYLYEMVSLDLGHSTTSFLSKVLKKVLIKHPLVFEGVSMNEFGELGESILLSNIQANLVRDYQEVLDFLIAEERSAIGLFLEMKRVEVIEAGLKRIFERRNRALA